MACSDCGREIDPLDVFPKNRCIDCHGAAPEVRRELEDMTPEQLADMFRTLGYRHAGVLPDGEWAYNDDPALGSTVPKMVGGDQPGARRTRLMRDEESGLGYDAVVTPNDHGGFDVIKVLEGAKAVLRHARALMAGPMAPSPDPGGASTPPPTVYGQPYNEFVTEQGGSMSDPADVGQAVQLSQNVTDSAEYGLTPAAAEGEIGPAGLRDFGKSMADEVIQDKLDPQLLGGDLPGDPAWSTVDPFDKPKAGEYDPTGGTGYEAFTPTNPIDAYMTQPSAQTDQAAADQYQSGPLGSDSTAGGSSPSTVADMMRPAARGIRVLMAGTWQPGTVLDAAACGCVKIAWHGGVTAWVEPDGYLDADL